MKKNIIVNNETFKPFITAEQIKKRVKQLGSQINKDFKNKCPIFIGALNGSFIFFADLLREIKIDCEIDFLKLSSYGAEKISSGKVKLLKDLNCEVKNRDIIIVEDIVDTGLSIQFMKLLISTHKPKSVSVATLLLKPESVKDKKLKLEYIGFKIPNNFVVGYGLDYAQKGRNLPQVYSIIDKKIVS